MGFKGQCAVNDVILQIIIIFPCISRLRRPPHDIVRTNNDIFK